MDYNFYMENFDILSFKNKLKDIFSSNIEVEEKLKLALDFCNKTINENHIEFNLDKIDCKAGCGHCCILNVATFEPEIKNIIAYVNEVFDEKSKDELKKRIIGNYIMVLGLDDEERIFLRKKCVFLDENLNCSIYPVRPILCRSVTSTSEERCKDAIAATSFDENIPIISNLYIKEVYLTLFDTFAEYLESVSVNSKSKKLTVWLKEHLEDIK